MFLWQGAAARLLALDLVELLFARSRAFRNLLAASFQSFLTRTVGHVEGQPLPGPPRDGAQLRERTLALLEAWHCHHGTLYPQASMTDCMLMVGGACMMSAAGSLL